MFLEERVEQLEHLAVDQGRQLESVARGLADLTVDVRAIRKDQTEGFVRIDERFTQLDARVDEMQAEFNNRLDGMKAQFNTRLDDMQAVQRELLATQQLMLKIMTEGK